MLQWCAGMASEMPERLRIHSIIRFPRAGRLGNPSLPGHGFISYHNPVPRREMRLAGLPRMRYRSACRNRIVINVPW